jgi:FkbM family methyltransferase
MTYASVRLWGAETKFHVENPADHIQKSHVHGKFYEINQLTAHRDVIARQSTVVDVGANVGNHTIFYAQHTPAKRVYPIEANPAAIDILSKTVAGNPRLQGKIDLGQLGVAVGREQGTVSIVAAQPNNLGGTKFSALSDSGAIKCVRLDSLQFEGRIGFMKIDVERTEMDVLAGAEELISRFRPAMAIEVGQPNEQAFWRWADTKKYRVIRAFFDYVGVKNYLCIPAT